MYFKEIPNMYYQFDIGNGDELKIVKDITHNVRVRKEILENVTLFDEYDLKDGETPEILAAKIYGDSEYHWVIMLCNQKYDHINDFPMQSQVFIDYLKDKYGGEVTGIHHYTDVKGNIIGYDKDLVPAEALPVTNYDYEVAQNESKRRIKLISPKLLSIILQNFKSMI